MRSVKTEEQLNILLRSVNSTIENQGTHAHRVCLGAIVIPKEEVPEFHRIHSSEKQAPLVILESGR